MVKKAAKKGAVKGQGSARKRQYCDREKAAALAFLDFNGGNVQKAAKALGIPNSTLDEWAKGRNQSADVPDLRNEKKDEISGLIEAAVRDAVGASNGKLGEATFQQLWTGIGIAVDKMQLLKGEPTAINKSLTDEERARKAAEILERGKLRLVKSA